mgnify:CR=1 FL=1
MMKSFLKEKKLFEFVTSYNYYKCFFRARMLFKVIKSNIF